MRRIILIVTALCTVIIFAGCSWGFAKEKTPDYSNESVIGSASENTDVISELSNIIYALSVSSIELPEFSDTGGAVEKCKDSLLNHLLTTGYSRFSGSTEILKNASEEYPHLSIASAIGKSDFEGALYKYFNHGGNIRHSDTNRFRYLSKISAYIPSVRETANNYSIDIKSIEETSSTYRMKFYLSQGNDISPEYYAVFVKRDKNGCYIQSLAVSSSEKITVDLPLTFS